VLWAGRFCAQKRLDLLLQVASAMPDVTFDVHGTGAAVEAAPYLRKLKALSNVRVMGAFENFADIVRSDHVAYLFTSGWEGIPTILMDACAAGLPIVASDVGAVSDLLPASSLVADVNDPQSYCMALRQLMSDPVLCQERRLQQYAALASGRSWRDFTDTLARIDCYLPTQMTAQTTDSTRAST
jgi:glycosyltransferase involved in cell wall biosynthesis